MAFVARILVAVIGLTNVLLSTGLQRGRAKAKAGEFGKRESFGRKACPSRREVFGGDKTDIYLLLRIPPFPANLRVTRALK